MFQNHIHNMRGIAILGIVGAHSIHAFRWEEGPWSSFRVLDTLCNQSSILFFFIAGYLFQHLSGRFQYADYLKKKAMTVIVPYLILSLPAVIVAVSWSTGAEPMYRQDSVPDDFYSRPPWQQIIFLFLTGKQLAPFWFVPTISLFYLAAPLLLLGDRKGWIYWFLPLLIAFSAWAGRDLFFGPPAKAAYLLSIYVLGMFFSAHKERCLGLARRFRWPILAATLGLFLLNVGLHKPHHGILYGFKLGLCFLGVDLLEAFDGLLKKRFDRLAHMSFGLFFVHGYVIKAFTLGYQKGYGSESLPDGRVWAYFLFALVVLVVSVTGLIVAKKIFGRRSRMIVGC